MPRVIELTNPAEVADVVCGRVQCIDGLIVLLTSALVFGLKQALVHRRRALS